MCVCVGLCVCVCVSVSTTTLMPRLRGLADKSTVTTFVSDLRDRAGPYLAALGSAQVSFQRQACGDCA